MGADSTLLLWINQGWGGPGLDFLMHWVSQRGGFALPLLLLLLPILWRGFRGDGVRLWLLLLLGLGLGDLLGHLLKGYFALPRPCYELAGQLRALGGGVLPQCDAPASGMPSNHALNSFYVAAFLSYSLRHRRVGLAFFLIALLVGLSRIYLGKHYPSQVLAGAAIGLLWGYLFAWLGLHGLGFGRRFLDPGYRRKLFSRPWPAPWGRLLLAGRPHPRFYFSWPDYWLPPLLFLLLALLIWQGGWNRPLFLWFNRLGPLSGDGLWAGLTLFGDTLVALALLGLFAHRRLDILGGVLYAALFATLWVHLLKPLLDLPRPLAVLGPDQVHVIGMMLRHHSFPSGHTTTVFTLAGVIVLRRVHPLLLWPVVLLALAAGISRAVVGAHWPLDILAGPLVAG